MKPHLTQGALLLSLSCALSCEPHVFEFFPGSASDDDAAPPEGHAGSGPRDDDPPPPPASALYVTTEHDLSQRNTDGRSCADGGDIVSYEIVSISTDRVELSQAPSDGCLTPGDELLLIQLQGTPSSHENVGEHELLRVRRIRGKTLHFVAPKIRHYGARLNQDELEGARVVVQRVPHYSSLDITAEGNLTASAWNGSKGGVLALRVLGDAVVTGRLQMDAKGYRGGELTDPVETPGEQGESLRGLGTRVTENNLGGGGGGIGDQLRGGCQQDGYPGGGGGHKNNGKDAVVVDLCEGEGRGIGGSAYAHSGKLFLGSGGGSGGTDNIRVDNPPGGAGGRGGGIVWILAQSIGGTGALSAQGEAGQGDPPGVECLGGSTTRCYDHSGPGGGGAGGSLLLNAPHLMNVRLNVAGGPGGNGNDEITGNGGDGADGVILRN